MMYCKKCGHQISDNDEFCIGCKTSILELKSNDNIIYKKNIANEVKIVEDKGVNPVLSEFTPKNGDEKKDDAQDFFGNDQYDASKYLDSTRANTLLLKAVIVILSLILIAISSYLVWEKIINKKAEEVINEVNYQGFTFSITTDYIYEVKNNSLYISDKDIKWTAQISIADLSFNQLVINKTSLNDELVSIYGASEATIQKINDNDYLTMDAVYNSSNFVIALSKASNTKTFIITIPYFNNDKFDLLNELNDVLLNTKVNKQIILNETDFNDNILTNILK